MLTNDTPLHEMNTRQLRAAYREALRGLTYDNSTKESVGLAVSAKVTSDASPVDFVKAIREVRCFCRRCGGTGRWARSWDVTDPKNPRPVGGGTCFRCGGAGVQDYKDGHRNRVADENYMARAI